MRQKFEIKKEKSDEICKNHLKLSVKWMNGFDKTELRFVNEVVLISLDDFIARVVKIYFNPE